MTRHGSITTDLFHIIVPIIILGVGIAGFGLLSNLRQRPEQVAEVPQLPVVETVAVESYQERLDSFGAKPRPASRWERATMPILSQNPQFTVRAGRPSDRRWNARASRNALAAA